MPTHNHITVTSTTLRHPPPQSLGCDNWTKCHRRCVVTMLLFRVRKVAVSILGLADAHLQVYLCFLRPCSQILDGQNSHPFPKFDGVTYAAEKPSLNKLHGDVSVLKFSTGGWPSLGMTSREGGDLGSKNYTLLSRWHQETRKGGKMDEENHGTARTAVPLPAVQLHRQKGLIISAQTSKLCRRYSR
jgi:hypothetical protein